MDAAQYAAEKGKSPYDTVTFADLAAMQAPAPAPAAPAPAAPAPAAPAPAAPAPALVS